jgi:hypothetical protein
MRGAAAMRRLAARGITPATPGVYFSFLWGQGEIEVGLGTTQAVYAARLATIKANMIAAGFSGRFFINVETWAAGSVSAAVQAAQAAFVDNVSVFAGGNLDTLNATYRHPDNVHFKDNGAASAATLIHNAMRASGAPY